MLFRSRYPSHRSVAAPWGLLRWDGYLVLDFWAAVEHCVSVGSFCVWDSQGDIAMCHDGWVCLNVTGRRDISLVAIALKFDSIFLFWSRKHELIEILWMFDDGGSWRMLPVRSSRGGSSMGSTYAVFALRLLRVSGFCLRYYFFGTGHEMTAEFLVCPIH